MAGKPRARSKGAETCGALNKTAKQPADNDGLNPPVRTDFGEAFPNGTDGSTLGQGGQQKQCTKNDIEQRDGQQESLYAGSNNHRDFNLPNAPGDHHGNGVGHGHGLPGRHSKAHQQDPYR